LLTGLLAGGGCASFRHPGDTWTGPDKAKHFLVGGLIGAGSALAAQSSDRSDGEAVAVAVAVALPIGIGKEVYDQRVKKTYFSGKDLVWDLVGALAGGLVVVGLE
jgi:putative lipoprotein